MMISGNMLWMAIIVAALMQDDDLSRS